MLLGRNDWRTIGSVLCGPVMSQKRASSVWRAERLLLVLFPEFLDFVIVGRPLLALERERWLRPKLRWLESANGFTFGQVEETVIGIGM